uniref:Uncharacterized protein n=1 Tax=Arabidopsis halleri subsp. halleri TaxID=81971 RepID=I0J3D3_ARAHH|nr:hypothetical protein [Arabidopsis halleri subsp. halleri]
MSTLLNERNYFIGRGLPSQYEFTPANRQAPLQDSEREPIAQPPTGPTIRDYPPPTQLFQSGEGSPRGSGSPCGSPSPRRSGATPFLASGSTQPRSGGSVHRLASTSKQSPAAVQREASNQFPAPVQREESNPPPRQASNPSPRASVSHHSSQAQNSHAEEDEDEEAEFEADYERESTLPEDSLATLHELLLQPGREKYTTVISPTFEPETLWTIDAKLIRLGVYMVWSRQR